MSFIIQYKVWFCLCPFTSSSNSIPLDLTSSKINIYTSSYSQLVMCYRIDNPPCTFSYIPVGPFHYIVHASDHLISLIGVSPTTLTSSGTSPHTVVGSRRLPSQYTTLLWTLSLRGGKSWKKEQVVKGNKEFVIVVIS